jgi:uncharacterized protein (TIGR00297 family)
MLNEFLAYGWARSTHRLGLALAITVSFALLALALRGVNRSGALAGGAACLLLFIAAGPPAFATLVTLFLLTWAATRFGFRRKQELGLSERREGRNAAQVLANLGVAATCAVLAASTRHAGWLLAMVGALAEAATDTVASEIGQTSRSSSRLITTWQPVPSGTDGGITLMGTLAGTVAGLSVGGVAVAAGMIPVQELWIPTTAGIIGMLADSFLGATLQQQRWINNSGVNLAGTLIAAALAYALPRS